MPSMANWKRTGTTAATTMAICIARSIRFIRSHAAGARRRSWMRSDPLEQFLAPQPERPPTGLGRGLSRGNQYRRMIPLKRVAGMELLSVTEAAPPRQGWGTPWVWLALTRADPIKGRDG